LAGLLLLSNGLDGIGKEILMDSRGSLTVQRVTAVDAGLAAKLDALFDEGNA
jgi:hypothetical protein